jgi:uncharacterized protein
LRNRLQNILSELRRSFESLYGDRLVEMILYGSQARGDADSGSDIDVLVVLKEPVQLGLEVDRTSTTVADLSLNYAVVISCTFMGEDRYAHRNGPLLRNIRREGVVL